MAIIDLTISALKQLITPSLNNIYYVTDYGQEGEWKCISLTGNSPCENNTNNILIGDHGAKFVRVYSGGVNILWFKTIRNTWTDAIQKAINAADEIYFPYGIYHISGTLTIAGNKRLFGSGIITKEKTAPGFFQYLKIIGPDTNVKIEGLTFDGDSDNDTLLPANIASNAYFIDNFGSDSITYEIT
jgi:hypothetical protein